MCICVRLTSLNLAPFGEVPRNDLLDIFRDVYPADVDGAVLPEFEDLVCALSRGSLCKAETYLMKLPTPLMSSL